MNDRRGFLKMMVGGVAATAAIKSFPFRVFSFPSEVKVYDPPIWRHREVTQDFGKFVEMRETWKPTDHGRFLHTVVAKPGSVLLLSEVVRGCPFGTARGSEIVLA